MNKLICAGLVLLVCSAPAFAGSFAFVFSYGSPAVVAPAPIYVPPVFVAPAPAVYYAPPVYVAPPAYVAPQPVYSFGFGFYRHGHRRPMYFHHRHCR